jgi:plasmid stabilization system protein ParE
MKRHKVVFSKSAAAELISSVEWGQEAWGSEAALKWYSEMRQKIEGILGSFPLSQPTAADSEEYEVEVRQLNVGRYRVLFNVTRSAVTILHI